MFAAARHAAQRCFCDGKVPVKTVANSGFQRVGSADPSFTQRLLLELPPWLRNLLPVPKPELMFKEFPKQPGHVGTLGGIIFVNGCVWTAWQMPANEDFMERNFLYHNSDIPEGRYWTILTSSFSHKDWNHITGNLVLLAVLGKKLHQLVGRAKFCLLYLMSSLGGSLGTYLDPAADADAISKSVRRYQNILIGDQPGAYRALGASDAVMGVLAAFYLTFPRTPVPIFRKFHLVTQVIGRVTPKLGERLERIPILNIKMSALWLLPMYFLNDIQSCWTHFKEWSNDPQHYTAPMESVGHAAHGGGMAGGCLFYLGIVHSMKRRYFDFTFHEMWRRAFIMTVSLTFWSGAWVKKVLDRNNTDKVDEKKGNASEPDDLVLMFRYKLEEPADGKPQAGESQGKTPPKERYDYFKPGQRAYPGCDDLPATLLGEANRCTLHEVCRHDGRGACDGEFQRVRAWMDAHADQEFTVLSHMAILPAKLSEQQCKKLTAPGFPQTSKPMAPVFFFRPPRLVGTRHSLAGGCTEQAVVDDEFVGEGMQ